MDDDLPPWVTEGPPDEGNPAVPPPLQTDAHATYEYRYGDGSLAFIVARWEANNGHKKKRFSPFCWNGSEWVAKQLVPAGQRPLFNLDKIEANPAAPILWVEGEKKALAAQKYLSKEWIVTCWAGGAEAIKGTDITPLSGRHVVAWPDNNTAGINAVKKLATAMPSVHVVDLPFDLPDGWDLGDPLPEGRDAAWVQTLITGAAPTTPAQSDPITPIPPPRGVPFGKLYYLTDIDAQDAPPRDYYLKGLLSPGEMSVWYGEPGCGKSFLALYVARAIAQARQVFGKRVKATNVLFMALEGVSGFEKRLKAHIEHYGEAERFGYVAQPVNLFSDKEARESVIKMVTETKTGFVVVDTLNRAMAEGSENTPEDMGKFIGNVDALRAATGAHVMIVHHSGKDSARGMRGHSSLLGAADVAVEVAKETDSKQRTATVRKAKDDADGDRFAFYLEPHELGEDDDKEPITTCIVRESEAATPQEKNPLTPTERQWLEVLREAFLREDNVEVVRPEPGMQPQPTMTRDQIRGWFCRRGLLNVTGNVTPDSPLSGSDRNKLSNTLRELMRKKKIGINGNLIWLI